LKYYPLIH